MCHQVPMGNTFFYRDLGGFIFDQKKDWKMKKRTFLSLIFLVIFSAMFANNLEIFKVGDYTILAIYEGQNNRDAVFKKLKSVF